ncbi:MAG: hypothetical protein FD134_794 [Gallionellaceae bacterium]|nr:MAG: hypothetical protein FD134_794 [Gallionellaceae bacterium]
MSFAARLIILLLCAAPFRAQAAPQPAAAPSQIKASYDVLKGGIKGVAISETFTRTQDHYRIESVSKAVGLLAAFKPEIIRVTSEGVITDKGLRPSTYIQERKLDSGRNTRADFDWNGKRITLIERASELTQPLLAGTQDRLSAMYQFMFTPLQNASALDFYMTNGSKVDIYNYLVTPGQSVTTPLGTFQALHVASLPKPGESRTEIWLSTEHANFPFKMVVTDPDGDQLVQEITQYNVEP